MTEIPSRHNAQLSVAWFSHTERPIPTEVSELLLKKMEETGGKKIEGCLSEAAHGLVESLALLLRCFGCDAHITVAVLTGRFRLQALKLRVRNFLCSLLEISKARQQIIAARRGIPCLRSVVCLTLLA